MELITPSVEIWEQDSSLNGIWEHIARCTRVCYQSTSNIKQGETAEEFVKRVILRRDSSTGELNWNKLHGAMLEHGTVYLKYYRNIYLIAVKYSNNKYSKVVNIGDYYYVTTNLRVLYENNWLDDLKYICAPTEHHVKRVTVSFITNIGVTREFNRHRVNSMAEESTRYCNYAKPRQISNINSALGSSTIVNDTMSINGQMRFGLPSWLLDEENLPYIESHQFDKLPSYIRDFEEDKADDWCDIDYYLFALTCAEYCYNNLIAKGWKPQQAREVLPLATNSQLIHTAFVDDWKHFFALRADGISGPPHPNAKLIAKPLKQEFIKHNLL